MQKARFSQRVLEITDVNTEMRETIAELEIENTTLRETIALQETAIEDQAA